MRILNLAGAIAFGVIGHSDSTGDYIFRNSFEVECDGYGCTFCSPADPAPICGAGAHCGPTSDATSICTFDVGPGTAGALCTSLSDCAASYLCVNTGQASDSCRKWCAYPSASGCGGGESCYPFNPPVLIGGTEWGVCL